MSRSCFFPMLYDYLYSSHKLIRTLSNITIHLACKPFTRQRSVWGKITSGRDVTRHLLTFCNRRTPMQSKTAKSKTAKSKTVDLPHSMPFLPGRTLPDQARQFTALLQRICPYPPSYPSRDRMVESTGSEQEDQGSRTIFAKNPETVGRSRSRVLVKTKPQR